MRARDIVGKKIVELRQQRVRTTSGDFTYAILALRLDDGSKIIFHTLPLEDHNPVSVADYSEAKNADR